MLITQVKPSILFIYIVLQIKRRDKIMGYYLTRVQLLT